ncbi:MULTISPECIES: two-component system sensor histidine kinase RppB [Okeania]|uniref:histidine kinase n=1 Tax=Okeania hirsuta TaxID=1458930 RepID=A0A3N6PIV5_9CYAN|nr:MULTISPECIES: two-component system sensor histidine kinase RppB [Okeania]NET12568.1 HAMP domain-containing histidine kinase [Okeania sp. SIO1H6]NES77002.1 HAMP domain-containing histidine kinase [Okeania sp. SIO1H4]NET20571.1 HAMP domain-containing histidine kinase [Okeania sp. SIO1H5]NET79278.1 HAMP domain-containing histidine kinase [Okeania sp. SIO1F9]NET96930.1 HAMP domain-containing histidine kinase [Okeania sp. SIO1H2]
MHENKLFQRTRLSLASWYVMVMGIILSICTLGFYEAILHAHRITIDRELKSVAKTIHDSLKVVLKQPSKLTATATRILPDLCLVETSCDLIQSHLTRVPETGNYYLRLLDRSNNLIAIAGLRPKKLQLTQTAASQLQTLTSNGKRYRQISLMLHTQDASEWGYLQVGRSLQDFDEYIKTVTHILLLGLPIGILSIAGASWWLSGKAMRPIYHSYRQIQQFTADAAHELRTPLAAIRATVESTLMLPKLTEVEARETLEIMARQNQRLSQMVADLLVLCRMDSGMEKLPQKQECICLNDLVNDIAEEFAFLAVAAKVKLLSEIRVFQPVEVMGNTEQLYRLVSNLVVNAINYTNPEGEVKIILEVNVNSVFIHVKDTGIGIPEREQKRIFDRFYRVNSDRSRQSGGSGLGLSIAVAIAQLHQGNVTVQSLPDRGSTFTLKLPLVSQI